MLLEAGLCIVQQRESLDASGALPGGVLTPAAAFGHVLINRLRDAGMTFELVERGSKGQAPSGQ